MKKRVPLFITVVIILLVLGIGIYNACCNDEFWDASVTTCISLIVAAVLSFYFVQRRTDQRKQKEIFIQLLESLKVLTDAERSFKLSGVSREEILMQKRTMNNKLNFIKKYSVKFSLQKEVDFLEEKYTEYDTIIGDHINDLETLSKLTNELKRPLSLMSQKLFEIMLNLYE